MSYNYALDNNKFIKLFINFIESKIKYVSSLIVVLQLNDMIFNSNLNYMLLNIPKLNLKNYLWQFAERPMCKPI
ncbi:hypothetical protein MetfoDRAFT_0298 [Methanotorris formicicus Mc-S-70]|uniref:Uncharacterized protein n=1 Tax=Methanotorris formicicus Mc-S-70 TaxID=647171 RepID=H1KWX5_9EURY|nr:hypothetical protein MetfoDRAFT_0298 [Methanotorris formicicus Mc-S-70]